MTETEKICYKRYKLAYIAFIAVYPFNLEKKSGEENPNAKLTNAEAEYCRKVYVPRE